MTTPTGRTTLHAAQRWMLHRLRGGEAVICPLCTQHAKVYRRKITSGMAQALIEMWKHAGTEWFDKPLIQDRWRSRDEAHLALWGLIAHDDTPRPDGGARGIWRVTERGEAFVRGIVRVPKYRMVYDGKLTRMQDESGETVDIRDALADRFDYDDLMKG